MDQKRVLTSIQTLVFTYLKRSDSFVLWQHATRYPTNYRHTLANKFFVLRCENKWNRLESTRALMHGRVCY